MALPRQRVRGQPGNGSRKTSQALFLILFYPISTYISFFGRTSRFLFFFWLTQEIDGPDLASRNQGLNHEHGTQPIER
jgi:hypothetical protein